MSEQIKLLQDSTPIYSVWGEDGQTGATVGLAGVTAISVYREVGNGAMVPWFKVWKGGRLHARLNAQHMTEVVYQN